MAPQTDTAVRSASIGFAVRGRARRADITADGTRPAVRRAFGIPRAGPQQVGDRGERTVGDEVADPVAPVHEAAVHAVDEAELGLRGDNALEAG